MVLAGIGLALSMVFLLSPVALFLAFRSSLDIPFVPKVREEGSGIEPEALARSFSSFFGSQHAKRHKTFSRNVSGFPPFKLKGVLLSDRLSGAVVLDGGALVFVGLGETYRGYRLEEVRPDGAVFSAGSERYELSLEFEKGKGGVSVPPAGGREVVVSRREVDALTRDPAKMFTQIRLVPYVEGGKTKGFVFEWVKKGSLFDRLGIRRGDILVSINNMSIRSGEDAFRLLQMLRNEPNLKIVLIRRGKKEEIDVRIE